MKHTIGGKINSVQEQLNDLVEMRDVLTDFSRMRNKNITVKFNLDVEDQKNVEDLLQQFNEKSKTGMNDYFMTKSKALTKLTESWDELKEVEKEHGLGKITDEVYQQKYDKKANEIVRLSNAYVALSGSVEDANKYMEQYAQDWAKKSGGTKTAQSIMNDYKQLLSFSQQREKILMDKSGGGYMYTVKGFEDMFKIIKDMEPYLETLAGISKNYLGFSASKIPIEEFNELAEAAQKAEKYLSEVYETYGTGELRPGTRNEIIKQLGIAQRYYEFLGQREKRTIPYSEAIINAQKMDIPPLYTKEVQYDAGREIISSGYDKIVEHFKKEAQKNVDEAREAMTAGYEQLLNTKEEVIDSFNKSIDRAKEKISYLKIEREKNIAAAWGTFEGARPKFSENGSVMGAYKSNTAFTEASDLHDSLFAQIQEGAITADEAIKQMAEHLFQAVAKGQATPFISEDVIAAQEEIEKLKNEILELQKALKDAKDDVSFWRDISRGDYGSTRALEENLATLKEKLSEVQQELEDLYKTFGDTLQWRGKFGAEGGTENDSNIQELQNIIDGLKNEISVLENKLSEANKDMGGGPGGGGPDEGGFGQCCKTLNEIKSDLDELTPAKLATAFRVSEVVESLKTASAAVSNVNSILSQGKGGLKIQNVTNIGSGDDPLLKQRYEQLYEVFRQLITVERKQTQKYTVTTQRGEVQAQLDDLYKKLEMTEKLDIASLHNEMQVQAMNELKFTREAIASLEERLAQMPGENEIVQTTKTTSSIKGMEEILSAIVNNVKEVKKEYDIKPSAFLEDYSMSTIEGLPLSDRIIRLERLIGWIGELRKNKIDLGPELNKLIAKAVKQVPKGLLETQAKPPEFSFSDMISKIQDTLEEIARLVSQIANSYTSVEANDVPNLGAKFLSDRNQNLKNLYDRIEKKDNGNYANKVSNQERIKDFLRQFNTYGNGEWDLDEFARINNISKKNLDVLKKYNEELFGVKEKVEDIADKQEEIHETASAPVDTSTDGEVEKLEEKKEITTEIVKKEEESIVPLETKEDITDRILEKEKEITEEKEKQEELEEKISNTKKHEGELAYMTDEHGNVRKWYRGLYGSTDAGAFESQRYGGGTFWTTNPMTAASYGEEKFPQRLYESLQASYKPFVVDAHGRGWHDLSFFGFDEKAQDLQEDYQELFDLLQDLGVESHVVSEFLIRLDGQWNDIFPILEKKAEGRIKNLESALEKAGIQVSDWCMDYLDLITSNEYFDTMLYDLNTAMKSHGLADLLDRNHIGLKTEEVVDAVIKKGGYDSIIFKDIIDIGGGGSISPHTDADREDFKSDIIVQLNPEHVKHLRSGPSSEFLDETFVKHLVRELDHQFAVANNNLGVKLQHTNRYGAHDNPTEDFSLFKQMFFDDTKLVDESPVLKYFMNLPEEVSKRIFNILTSDTINTYEYSEPLAEILSIELKDIMEDGAKQSVNQAYKLLEKMDTTGVLEDKEMRQHIKERLKDAQESFAEGDEFGQWYLDRVAEDFAPHITSKDVINEHLLRGGEAIEQIMRELIVRAWSEYNSNKDKYELPSTNIPENTESQKESIDNLQEEKEAIKEVNEQLEKKNELLEQNNATVKEEPTPKVDEQVKEETAVGEVTDAIQDKTEAFEDEQKIVDEVIDAEKAKLTELRDTIEGVANAIEDKTKAFEAEGEAVNSVLNEENNVPALETQGKVLDDILEKEEKITEEKEKQQEVNEEIKKEEENIADIKKNQTPYLTDKYGNTIKWYRGTHGDADAGTFASHNYGDATFWTTNPMVAQTYGEMGLKQRITESQQAAKNPFVLDAKGRDFASLIFFGLDEKARQLKEDYDDAEEILKQIGITDLGDIDECIETVVQTWSEIFPILMENSRKEIKDSQKDVSRSVFDVFDKKGIELEGYEIAKIRQLTNALSGAETYQLRQLDDALTRNGLLKRMAKMDYSTSTDGVVSAVKSSGKFDAVLFRNIIDIGSGGSVHPKSASQYSDFIGDELVQFKPENILPLRNGTSLKFFTEKWIEYLASELAEEFENLPDEFEIVSKDGNKLFDKNNFQSFKQMLLEEMDENLILPYFMSFPEEVSKHIYDIIAAEEVDTTQYSEPIAEVVAQNLQDILEKSLDKKEFIKETRKYFKEIGTPQLKEDEDFKKYGESRLKSAFDDLDKGDRAKAQRALKRLARDVAPMVNYNNLRDEDGDRLDTGLMIGKIKGMIVSQIISDYMKANPDFKLPEEINMFPEGLPKGTSESHQETLDSLEEEKEVRKEINDLIEEKNELEKEEPVEEVDTGLKEESSIGEVTGAIEEKTSAFENEKTVVDTVVDAEKAKLTELKEAVDAVTNAVKEKTSAFEEEVQKVGEAITTEQATIQRQEVAVQPIAIEAATQTVTQGGAAQAVQGAVVTGTPLTATIEGTINLQQAAERAAETVEHLRDSYESFALALRDNHGELSTAVETLGQMNDVAEDLAGSLNQLGEEEDFDADAFEDAMLRYVKAGEAFDNLIERIPDKMRGRILPFDQIQEEVITIDNAIEDIKERASAVNSMDVSDEKTEAMNELAPKIAKYTAVIKEFLASQDLLANSLAMQRTRSKIQDYLNKNTALTEDQREALLKLRDEISNAFDGNENISMTRDELEEVNIQVDKIIGNARQLGTEGKSALYKMSQQIAHLNERWVGQLLSFHDIIRYIRTMATEVKNIDSALIELKKVTDGLTMERLNVSLENSFKTARELGSEVVEVINTTADWARLGYGIEDAEHLASITTLFRNVGDNMTTDTASEYLISTLKGFEMIPDEALTIVDKFNEVAKKLAKHIVICGV